MFSFSVSISRHKFRLSVGECSEDLNAGVPYSYRGRNFRMDKGDSHWILKYYTGVAGTPVEVQFDTTGVYSVTDGTPTWVREELGELEFLLASLKIPRKIFRQEETSVMQSISSSRGARKSWPDNANPRIVYSFQKGGMYAEIIVDNAVTRTEFSSFLAADRIGQPEFQYDYFQALGGSGEQGLALAKAYLQRMFSFTPCPQVCIGELHINVEIHGNGTRAKYQYIDLPYSGWLFGLRLLCEKYGYQTLLGDLIQYDETSQSNGRKRDAQSFLFFDLVEALTSDTCSKAVALLLKYYGVFALDYGSGRDPAFQFCFRFDDERPRFEWTDFKSLKEIISLDITDRMIVALCKKFPDLGFELLASVPHKQKYRGPVVHHNCQHMDIREGLVWKQGKPFCLQSEAVDLSVADLIGKCTHLPGQTEFAIVENSTIIAIVELDGEGRGFPLQGDAVLHLPLGVQRPFVAVVSGRPANTRSETCLENRLVGFEVKRKTNSVLVVSPWTPAISMRVPQEGTPIVRFM